MSQRVIKHCILTKHFSEAGQTQDPTLHCGLQNHSAAMPCWEWVMAPYAFHPLNHQLCRGTGQPDSCAAAVVAVVAVPCWPGHTGVPMASCPCHDTKWHPGDRGPGASGHREGHAALTRAPVPRGLGWSHYPTRQKLTPCLPGTQCSSTSHSHEYSRTG